LVIDSITNYPLVIAITHLCSPASGSQSRQWLRCGETVWTDASSSCRSDLSGRSEFGFPLKCRGFAGGGSRGSRRSLRGKER